MDRCSSCDIELTDPVVETADPSFCCSGCADGGPCICSYSEVPKRSGNGHADPIMTLALLGAIDGQQDDRREGLEA
jgi:hypothetical protein